MTESRRRPAGRPRSEEARQAILDAAFALLCERGFAELSIEGVAARARVGKATIYRWWPGRGALAVEAFFRSTEAELRFPDTGSAREDFTQQILQLGRLLRGPAGAALAGMMEGARTDPELARAVAERWVLPRRRWGIERLHRAVQAGETPPALDVEAALDLLYGPLYARLLVGLGAPGDATLRRILDLAMRAIFVTRDAARTDP